VTRLIAAVRAAPSERTTVALLQGLWQQKTLFTNAQAGEVLAIGAAGDLSSQNLIGMLGSTLQGLLGSVHHRQAIDCLTDLLRSDGNAVPLERLQGIEHRLMQLDPPERFALFVHWLRSNDVSLGMTLASSITNTQRSEPFESSLAGQGLTSIELILLCHRAVGYLILWPKVAASFIVAALRVQDSESESELIALLNYPDSAAAYLKTIAKTDPAYRSIGKALKIYRAYRKDLYTEDPIKELQPSSYQRTVVRQKRYVEAKDLRKQVDSQSVFRQLVHRSTLLYGRKAITFVGGPDKPPVTMEMKAIGGGIESPRLMLMDPVGLDLMLGIFRTSTPK
jgi:hypothetical protein